MTEACSACKYFFKVNDTAGECRINPPNVFPVTQVDKDQRTFVLGKSFFPNVLSETWCGKFSPKAPN